MCPILSYQNIATLTPVYGFSKILNYFLLRKSDVIKITRTHSMAMMISGGLN